MSKRHFIRRVVGGQGNDTALSKQRLSNAEGALRQAQHLLDWAELHIKPKNLKLFQRIQLESSGLRAAILEDDTATAAGTALNMAYWTMRLMADRGFALTNGNKDGNNRKLPSDTEEIERELYRLCDCNPHLPVSSLRDLAGNNWGVGRTAITNRTKYNPKNK
jgi:hypothetical protein